MIMICESISLAVSATLRPRFVAALFVSLVDEVVVAVAPVGVVNADVADGVTEMAVAIDTLE